MYQAEHGERLKPEMLGGGDTPTGLKAQIMPYFNVLIDCGSYNNEKCIPYSGTHVNNPYKTYDGRRLPGLSNFDDGQFILTDGSIILIENMRNNLSTFITVDVNGKNKKPNKWGHDLFTFQLIDDGRILPMGAPEAQYNDKNQFCSPTSTNVRNGEGCTYYALTDKDYFNNLPR